MRIAALYDIHGNVHALEAVLAAVEDADPDLIVVGGDVAGGPFPVETTERLMHLQRPARFVTGNGDRELIAAYGQKQGTESDDPSEVTTRWCARQLSPRHIDFLRSFEALVTLEDAAGTLLFCHGSPRSDEELITLATPPERIEPMVQGLATGTTAVCGHTHMQFDRLVSGVRIVNAGSVGMPYELAPGAYWALVGDSVELRRSAYDLDAAAAAIRSTDWPFADEFAAENVLTVRTPEEAIAAFESPAPMDSPSPWKDN